MANKSVEVILGAIKSAGEAALRLHEENDRLRGLLHEENDRLRGLLHEENDRLRGLLWEWLDASDPNIGGSPGSLFKRTRAALGTADQPTAASLAMTDMRAQGYTDEQSRQMARDALSRMNDQPTDAALLAAAGYIKRDKRLQCDECGGMFTPQMLPIHNCAADNGGAK